MSLSGVSHSSLCSLFSSFWTDFALPSNWQWTLIFLYLFYFSSVFLCCYTLQKHLVSWNSLPTWPWDSKSNIIYLQTMNNLLLDFFVSISLLCINVRQISTGIFVVVVVLPEDFVENWRINLCREIKVTVESLCHCFLKVPLVLWVILSVIFSSC